MLALLLLAASLAMAYYLSRLVVRPRVYALEETRRLTIERGRMDPAQFDSWAKEEFTLPSRWGYDLYSIYLPLPGSRRTVVLTHGHTWSLYGMLKYVPLFRSRGCNVLLYDLRFHGRSGGQNITFGDGERYDLQQMVDWAFERLGPGGRVGTLGESLGAAISLLESQLDPRLSFVVSDCAFSDLTALLTHRMRSEIPWLPVWPFLPLTAWVCWLTTGMHMAQVSPRRALVDVNTPILFIHGQNDRYVPPVMARELYDAKAHGLRQLYLAPDARHAESIIKNPQAYDQLVGAFLDQVGFNSD